MIVVKIGLHTCMCWLLFVVCPAMLPVCFADGGEEDVTGLESMPVARKGEFKNAADILRSCRERMPKTPMLIKGKVKSRTARGSVELTMDIEVQMELGRQPPRACYSINDAFGKPIERLRVERKGDGRVDLDYMIGPGMKQEAPPELTEHIRGADLTWNDLTLSFLWWNNAMLVGQERIRGRACYVLDVIPPFAGNGDDVVSVFRVWLDKDLSVLLQMEAFNRKARKLRDLRVRSFKKMNDIWMVKDMSVRSYPERHRTTIRIDTVETIGNEEVEDQLSEQDQPLH